MLRSVKYGLNGAVLAGLIAAPVLWSSIDKAVRLDVDGSAVAVNTTADTVGQLLADRGYGVDQHDLVAPSATSQLKDGSSVVLRHGRLLRLDIDGRRREVWTTAPTVAAALDALGYTSVDFVSVSRSQRLPLTPTDLSIRTPKVVTVVHDGQREAVTTTDQTVGQLLTDLQITVGPKDRLSAAAGSALTAGQVVTLRRLTSTTKTVTVSVPFSTQRQSDASLASGTTQIVTAGRNGSASVTYSLVYLDGTLVGRTVLTSVPLSAASPQVVRVGTKTVAPVAANPDPGSAQATARTMLSARGWGSDQFDCLVTLWGHESGWRVNAGNDSGAYGIPQALPGSKMSSAGADWQTNAATQITWGLGYIAARYGTPCGAWSFWQGHNYY